MTNLLEEQQQEMGAAIKRSLSYGFIHSTPEVSAGPYLKSDAIRSEVASVCLSAWSGNVTGLCHLVTSLCIEHVKTRLGCEAWIVFGWLSDISIPDSFFWKMDPDDLCLGLKNGGIGIAEFHTWILLDSGEIVDPVVYPTLAAIFKKFSNGVGRCNILSAEGLPYKEVHGLPLLQYHPLAVAMS